MAIMAICSSCRSYIAHTSSSRATMATTVYPGGSHRGCSGRNQHAQRSGQESPVFRQVQNRTWCCTSSAAAYEEAGTVVLASVDQVQTGFQWLFDLPWQRVAAWAVLALFAWQLKDFFGIAMGTFIVSFIGNGFVQSLVDAPLWGSRVSPKTRRRLLVLIYFSVIFSVLTLFGVLTIPDLIREGSDFVSRLQSENIWVVVLEKLRQGVGDGIMDQLERVLMVASGEELTVLTTAPDLLWTPQRTQELGMVLQRLTRGYTEAAVSFTSNLVAFVSKFALQMGLSMVLSFMVVWDLPTIQSGVSSLKVSRLAPIYKEIAPSFSVFGALFGKALQAQARIAMVNTGLTALGMWALAIPGIGLLSLFVFICSFIPIAGCFISTVPIAFVALTEYGFLKLALVIVMVFGIHLIEAYGLNPAIYSAHLKLHPLLVLMVLVVAEHSLGVWGLLLAVPMTVFTLDYCIRYPACSVTDVAAKELENVSLSDREYTGPFSSQDFFSSDDEVVPRSSLAKDLG